MNNVRKLLGIDKLHEKGIRGKGVTVAIIDTGVSGIHPDLTENIIASYDGVNGKSTVYDDNGHGTHVAGIIAGTGKVSGGEYRGIAPEASIVVVKALNRSGRGRTNIAVDCIKWVLDNAKKYNIRIVNISIGTVAKSAGEEYDNHQLIYWVERMWEAGMVVVVAAGNNGPGNGTVTVPGISKKVITVGVAEANSNYSLHSGGRKSYSGRGPADCVMKPEIVAPGVGIISCSTRGNGYAAKSGSSMATPIVTGVITLILSVRPHLTNKEVKKILMETAVDLNHDKQSQGWGRISTDFFGNL